MAPSQLFTVLVILFAFSRIELISCSVVKGSVLCNDCHPHYDLSGIKVLVKCDQVKTLSMATTENNGAFETKLPSNAPSIAAASPSPNCLAMLLGGPNQLYASRKDKVSKITIKQNDNTYTVVSPLAFSKSCHGTCGSSFGSSKTFDLPIPPEYGLPPTSYYTPFIPIIGIP